MLGLEQVGKLTAALDRLNENIEANRPLVERLVRALEAANENAQAVKVTAKQLSVLNQILMQVRKAEGGAAMTKMFLEGVMKTAAKWATRSG